MLVELQQLTIRSHSQFPSSYSSPSSQPFHSVHRQRHNGHLHGHAASGIGKADAEALVQNGVIVVGLARRFELIEEHAKQLSNQKGKLYAFKTDITQESDIVNAFKWIRDNLGPVHILVNSAATFHESPLTEATAQELQTQFNTNVVGLCNATREAIAIMKENHVDGHIIHINSIAGHTAIEAPNLGAYSVTKFAVTSLTETLRRELIRLNTKIRISSVSPGLTATEMTVYRKENSEERANYLLTRPCLQPEDIADGVIYVLSTPQHVQIHELTVKPIGEPY